MRSLAVFLLPFLLEVSVRKVGRRLPIPRRHCPAFIQAHAVDQGNELAANT
ncbi:unnamed protein product, partial [Larinioides sclopetarius]